MNSSRASLAFSLSTKERGCGSHRGRIAARVHARMLDAKLKAAVDYGKCWRRDATKDSALLSLNVPLGFGGKKARTICLILSRSFVGNVASVFSLAP